MSSDYDWRDWVANIREFGDVDAETVCDALEAMSELVPAEEYEGAEFDNGMCGLVPTERGLERKHARISKHIAEALGYDRKE